MPNRSLTPPPRGFADKGGTLECKLCTRMGVGVSLSPKANAVTHLKSRRHRLSIERYDAGVRPREANRPFTPADAERVRDVARATKHRLTKRHLYEIGDRIERRVGGEGHYLSRTS